MFKSPTHHHHTHLPRNTYLPTYLPHLPKLPRYPEANTRGSGSVMRSCSGLNSFRPVYFSTKHQCSSAKRWPLYAYAPVYFASRSTTSRIIGNATLASTPGYTPHSPGPIAGPRERYRDGDDSNDMTRSARYWLSTANEGRVCPPHRLIVRPASAC
ncbi:hypothetical protein BDP81DRAFT_432823, partial [Colletotrichum phormii]